MWKGKGYKIANITKKNKIGRPYVISRHTVKLQQSRQLGVGKRINIEVDETWADTDKHGWIQINKGSKPVHVALDKSWKHQ